LKKIGLIVQSKALHPVYSLLPITASRMLPCPFATCKAEEEPEATERHEEI